LRIAALSFALLLTGCGQGYVYIRADGRDIGSDPALYKQLEMDSMTCQGEVHRENGPLTGRGLSGGPAGGAMNDCMTAKGYAVVQSEVAELKRQDLAAKTAGTPEAAAHGVAMESPKSSTGAATVRGAPVPAAADAKPIIEQCTRISDKAARLVCFDRAAAKGADNRR
jgi:hypothetical protein